MACGLMLKKEKILYPTHCCNYRCREWGTKLFCTFVEQLSLF